MRGKITTACSKSLLLHGNSMDESMFANSPVRWLRGGLFYRHLFIYLLFSKLIFRSHTDEHSNFTSPASPMSFIRAKGTSLIRSCSPAALAPGSAEGGSLGKVLTVMDKSQNRRCWAQRKFKPQKRGDALSGLKNSRSSVLTRWKDILAVHETECSCLACCPLNQWLQWVCVKVHLAIMF